MYLAQTYNKLFSLLATKDKYIEDDLLSSMLNIHKVANSKDGNIGLMPDNLLCFNVMSNRDSANCISKVLGVLKCARAEYKSISMPLSYMLDELVCNIQQHSMARIGILSVVIDSTNNFLDIRIADDGIGIQRSLSENETYILIC